MMQCTETSGYWSDGTWSIPHVYDMLATHPFVHKHIHIRHTQTHTHHVLTCGMHDVICIHVIRIHIICLHVVCMMSYAWCHMHTSNMHTHHECTHQMHTHRTQMYPGAKNLHLRSNWGFDAFKMTLKKNHLNHLEHFPNLALPRFWLPKFWKMFMIF